MPCLSKVGLCFARKINRKGLSHSPLPKREQERATIILVHAHPQDSRTISLSRLLMNPYYLGHIGMDFNLVVRSEFRKTEIYGNVHSHKSSPSKLVTRYNSRLCDDNSLLLFPIISQIEAN